MNEQEKYLEERVQKRWRFIVNVLYWGIIVAFVLLGIKVTEPILVPFIVAFIIAWVLHKPIDWLAAKTRVKKNIVALFVVIIFYAIIGTILTQAAIHGFLGLKEFFAEFPAFYEATIMPVLNDVIQWFEGVYAKIDPAITESIEGSSENIINSLAGFVTSMSSGALTWISSKAISIPRFLMKLLITLVVTVFITMDFPTIVNFLYRQMPEKTKKFLEEVRNYTGGTLLKCLKSYFIIMLITFTELMIGFLILGIPNAPALAGIIAMIDILPILGTGGVLIPWGIILIMDGEFKLAIGILLLYVIILVVRNILEPKIVGSQVGLHPAIALGSMFMGLQFFGLLGMFGFPVALSVIKNLNDRGVIHIIK